MESFFFKFLNLSAMAPTKINPKHRYSEILMGIIAFKLNSNQLTFFLFPE